MTSVIFASNPQAASTFTSRSTPTNFRAKSISNNSTDSGSSFTDSQNFLRSGIKQRQSSSRQGSQWQEESDRSFLELSLFQDVQMANELEDIAIPNIIDLPDNSQSIMLEPMKRRRMAGKKGNGNDMGDDEDDEDSGCIDKNNIDLTKINNLWTIMKLTTYYNVDDLC